jgi:uracil-DNA glycosylase
MSTKMASTLVTQDTSKVVLLVGQYAQNYYLFEKRNLTERVKNWREYQTRFLPLPHPSPRNNIWLENDILPQMQKSLKARMLANQSRIKTL